jgi:acetyl esterase/lipase
MITPTKVATLLVIFGLFLGKAITAQAPIELPLWSNGIPNNPVKYEKEEMRTEPVLKSSLSQKSTILRQVSEPTYTLYTPDIGTANGVAIVVCPGGGFEELWIDREGTDFAIWLASKGFTAMVLKYRTYNSNTPGFTLERDVFNGEVYADAKQAINILRIRADELGIDKNKVGISGFSSGGALSLFAALETFDELLPSYAKYEENTAPDFAGFIYGSVWDVFFEKINSNTEIPPMFLVNGGEDTGTPPAKCIKLYSALLEKNVPTELHIYAKGEHGFDSGIERGVSVASWRDSFVNWLTDIKIVEY